MERRLIATCAQGGGFTEQQVASIKNNLVFEKLEYLRAVTASAIAELSLTNGEVSECDVSRPQDPQIRVWATNWPCNVRLKVQLTGRDIAPAFTALSGKIDDRQTFQRFADQLNESVMKGTLHFIGLWQIDGNPKRGINPSRPSLDEGEQIEHCVKRICKLVEQHQG